MRRSTRLSLAMLCASAFAGSGAVAAGGEEDGKRLLDIASHACLGTSIEGEAEADFKPVAVGENVEIDAIRDYWEQGAKPQRARVMQFEVVEAAIAGEKFHVVSTKLEGQGSSAVGCRMLIPGRDPRITVKAFSEWAGKPADEALIPVMLNEKRWDVASWRGNKVHASMSFFDSTTKLPDRAPRFPFHGTIIQFSSSEISDDVLTAILKD